MFGIRRHSEVTDAPSRHPRPQAEDLATLVSRIPVKVLSGYRGVTRQERLLPWLVNRDHPERDALLRSQESAASSHSLPDACQRKQTRQSSSGNPGRRNPTLLTLPEGHENRPSTFQCTG